MEFSGQYEMSTNFGRKNSEYEKTMLYLMGDDFLKCLWCKKKGHNNGEYCFLTCSSLSTGKLPAKNCDVSAL